MLCQLVCSVGSPTGHAARQLCGHAYMRICGLERYGFGVRSFMVSGG